MRHHVKIVGIVALAVNLIAGLTHAQTKNPWALYQRGFQEKRALVLPRSTVPLAQVQPQNRAQNREQDPAVPQFYGNEYVPLPGSGNSPTAQQWPGVVLGQPQAGYYSPYGRQPYGYSPGYGYQMPFQGGYGGQFGFGMNFSPGFSGGGMPFGYGYPAMPFIGGGNPYSRPFGGFSPWGMGFPMF